MTSLKHSTLGLVTFVLLAHPGPLPIPDPLGHSINRAFPINSLLRQQLVKPQHYTFLGIEQFLIILDIIIGYLDNGLREQIKHYIVDFFCKW